MRSERNVNGLTKSQDTAQAAASPFPVSPTPSVSEGSGFTPRPWCLDGHNLSTVLHCTVPKGHPDAKHPTGDYETIARCEGPGWKANARLIAAAPRLYFELDMQVRNCPLCKGDGVTDQSSENLVRMICGNGDPSEKVDCPRCKSARAALSLASGSNPHV